MPKSKEELGWKELEIGCVVSQPGSASQYSTGTWRSQRPLWDNSKCIKCGFCYLYCPDACVRPNDEGWFAADLYYCKGCGICAQECPTDVITMVEEGE